LGHNKELQKMTQSIPIIFWLCLLISCNLKREANPTNNKEYEFYSQIFQEIDALLESDNGEFWGNSLNGPLILVDPETRTIYSNHDNSAGTFQQVSGVFVDTLPGEINMANTALEWDGIRWAMVMLPLPTDRKMRDNLIIHELFHRIQAQIGFENLDEQPNAHLDTYQGRLLLRLELEALIQAIHSTEENSNHIAHALRFRKQRYLSNEIKQGENTLELKEGLAEYTGLMLSGRSPDEIKRHFRTSVDDFYDNETFVRSFAYQTIPMYGYLLSKRNAYWHKEITHDTNLSDFFERAFDANLDGTFQFETVAKAHDYHFERIQKEELEREKKRLKVVSNYRELFTQKRTLKLVFENMSISFDPRNIVPIEDLGTVYPSLRLSDNWGVLTVESGALISADWQYILVSEPKVNADSVITGEGWKLELNQNWSVVKTGDTYELKTK
jgi:hypothetical protein